MRFAYADPPYPGKARLYKDHPDFGGEVDMSALLASLVADYPDGWALSTSAEALPAVLALCPRDVRVAAWLRGERPTMSYRPLNAWEPVIYCGGRPRLGGVDVSTRRVDALAYVARIRATDRRRVIGAKPAAFCWWLFDLLGALPGDELVDMYPGSGGVARAWGAYTMQPGRHYTSRVDRDEPSSSDPPENDALRSPRTPAIDTPRHLHRGSAAAQHNASAHVPATLPLFTAGPPWPG